MEARKSWLDFEADSRLQAAGYEEQLKRLRRRTGAEAAGAGGEEEADPAAAGLRDVAAALSEEEAAAAGEPEVDQLAQSHPEMVPVRDALADLMRPIFGESHVDEADRKRAERTKWKSLQKKREAAARARGVDLAEE